MRTKDNKMIRIAGRNVFCSRTIPQNATDKLVLIFSWCIRLFWKLERIPTQLCDKMETAGFCMIDWVMGNQTLDTHGQRLPWSGSRFSKEIIVSQIFTNFVLVGSSDGVSHYYMLLNTKTVEQL
jgi:hypothetical protein